MFIIIFGAVWQGFDDRAAPRALASLLMSLDLIAGKTAIEALAGDRARGRNRPSKL